MTNGTTERIFWTDEEWLGVALALLKKRPEFLTASYLPLGDGHDLRTAMQETLPKERWRDVPLRGGKSTYTRILAKIFAKLREVREATGEPIPVIEPAAQAKMHRIFWDKAEWFDIASAMARRFPRLLKAETADELDFVPSDIEHAQSVLPKERRREGKLHTTNIKPKLFEALMEVKKKKEERAQAAEEERAAHGQQQVLDAQAKREEEVVQATASAPAPEPAPAPEVRAIEQIARTEAGRVKLPAPAPAAAPAAAPEMNLYEAAFGPLVRPFMALFAHEIGKMLLPQITAVVRAEMGMTLADADHKAERAVQELIALRKQQVEMPAPAPQPAQHYAVPTFVPEKPLPFIAPPKPAPRPFKPSIGILSNRTKPYQEELQREFPDLMINVIDSHKKIPSIANCTKAISLISFVSHMADKRLKTATGLRYVPVNGTLTDIKRLIASWVNTGALLPGNAGVSGLPLMKEPKE